VSTTYGNPGNTGNLQFLIPPANTGNLMDINWSSWKFSTDATTTKEFSHKKFSSSPVV